MIFIITNSPKHPVYDLDHILAFDVNQIKHKNKEIKCLLKFITLYSRKEKSISIKDRLFSDTVSISAEPFPPSP